MYWKYLNIKTLIPNKTWYWLNWKVYIYIGTTLGCSHVWWLVKFWIRVRAHFALIQNFDFVTKHFKLKRFFAVCILSDLFGYIDFWNFFEAWSKNCRFHRNVAWYTSTLCISHLLFRSQLKPCMCFQNVLKLAQS